MFSRLLTMLFFAQQTLFFYPQEAKAADCQTGYEWNATTNTCVMSQSTRNLVADSEECKNLTGQAKQTCLLQNASSSTNKGTKDNTYAELAREEKKVKWDKGFEYAYKVSSLLVPLVIWKNKAPCDPKSWLVFYAGATAVAAGELANYWLYYKPKLKQMHDQYKDLTTWGTDNISAQKTAFKYLRDEQEILEQTSKYKAYTYTAAATLYLTSALWTAWEMIQEKTYVGAAQKEVRKLSCASKDSKIGKYLGSKLFQLFITATGVFPWDTKNAFNNQNNNTQSIDALFNLTQNKIKNLNISPEGILLESEKEAYAFNERNSSYTIHQYEQIKAEADTFTKIKKSIGELAGLFLINNASAMGPYDENTENPNSVIPTATATAPPAPTTTTAPLASAATTAAAGADVQKTVNETDRTVEMTKGQSWFRLSMATTMASLSTIIAARAYKISSTHKKRKEVLESVLASFPTDIADSDVGICTTADREDPSKKTCYCYIQENGVDKPNPARLKSDICASLFNIKTNNKTSDYELGKSNSPKVCIDKNGKVDSACKCKQQIDANKQNNCMKVPMNGNLSGILGMNMAGLNFGGTNSYLSGGLEGQNVNENTLGAVDQALNLVRKKGDEIFKQNKINASVGRNENAILDSLKKNALSFYSNSPSGPGISSSSGTAINNLPAKAIESIEKKAQEAGVNVSEIKNVLEKAPTNSESTSTNYDLGSTNDTATEELTMQGDVMAKNFNYGGNDISKQQDENLFKVISNRYLQSGFRRLFEEVPKEEQKAGETK